MQVADKNDNILITFHNIMIHSGATENKPAFIG